MFPSFLVLFSLILNQVLIQVPVAHAQSLTFDKDLDLNNHNITGVISLTATSVSVGSGGITFPGGLVQSAPFLGASQTLGATNISAGSFGASTTKGVYTFEAQGNTNPVLVIDGINQRVGVGKTSPAMKLDVNDDNSTSSLGIKIGSASADAFYLQRTFDVDNGYVRMMLGGNLYWDPGANLWNYGAQGSNAFGAVMAYGGSGLRFYTKPDSGNVAGTLSNSSLQSSYARMAISESGNVSIGTTTAGGKLHISSGDPQDIIRMTDEDTDDYYAFRFSATGDLMLDFYDKSAGTSYYPFKILNDARTDTLVVSSSNVGIGTAAPASKLTVAGAIESTSGGIKFPDGTVQASAASAVLSAKDVTAEVFGSNQGNGDFSFPNKLGIGYSTFNNITARLMIATGTTASSGIAFGGDTELYRSAAGTLALSSGDSLNLISGSLMAGGTNVITTGRVLQASNGSAASPAFTFSADQNSGLYGTGADIIRLVTAGADRLTVDASGDVGVGNAAPAHKLDVSGDINAGTLYRLAGNVIMKVPEAGSLFVGTISAPSNTGVHNTFVGQGAGNANTSAGSSTALGYRALYSNTTGVWNTAIGSRALYSNTTGIENVAVGANALYTNGSGGDYNTAVGHDTLYANIGGLYNVGVGIRSLVSNTYGRDNTAVGSYSLRYNSTGQYNTALGSDAMQQNTGGSYNVAAGYQALYYNTGGANNVALGSYALLFNSTGGNNVAIGFEALKNGVGGLGSGNVGIGHQAGSNVTGSGSSNNIFIGNDANGPIGSTISNAIAIGYGATVDGSNKLVLGGTGANAVNVGIGTTNPSVQLDVQGGYVSASSQPRVKAYRTSVQLFPANTETAINFDAESFDVGTLHNPASNSSRLTVPANGAGLYLIITNLDLAAQASNISNFWANISIRKNGAADLSYVENDGASCAGCRVTLNASVLDDAVPGDYYEVTVTPNMAGQTIGGSEGANYLTMVKVW